MTSWWLLAERRRWRSVTLETGVQWSIRYRAACFCGNGREAHRACTWLAVEHRANEARCAEVATDHGYHWRHVQRRSTPAACRLLSSVPQRSLRYSCPRVNECRRRLRVERSSKAAVTSKSRMRKHWRREDVRAYHTGRPTIHGIHVHFKSTSASSLPKVRQLWGTFTLLGPTWFNKTRKGQDQEKT